MYTKDKEVLLFREERAKGSSILERKEIVECVYVCLCVPILPYLLGLGLILKTEVLKIGCVFYEDV